MRYLLFVRHSIGTLISSMLLYYAFDVYCYGWILAIASFVLLFGIIEEISGKALLFICESLYVIVFIILQYSFLIRLAIEDVASLFVIMIVAAMYLLPLTVLSSCRISNNKPAIFAISFLLAEYLFSHSSVGNQMFQLGILLGDTTYIAQFYEYTGPCFGSLLIMLLSYGLYKFIRGHMFSGISVLIALFVCMIFGAYLYKKQCLCKDNVQISVLALNTSRELDSLLSSYTDTSDYLVLPEAVAEIHSANITTNSFITQMYRFSNQHDLSVIAGVYLYDDGKLYNNSYTISSAIKHVRSKEVLVPFAEYLPWKWIYKLSDNIVSKLPRQVYCVRDNINVYNDGVVSYSPIICYEALFSGFISNLCVNGSELFFVSSSNLYIDSDHIESITQKIIQTNAISCRRSFVRSTENGRSMFVDIKGRVCKSSGYTPSIITCKVPSNTHMTFYSLYFHQIENLYYLILLFLYAFCGFVHYCPELLPDSINNETKLS